MFNLANIKMVESGICTVKKQYLYEVVLLSSLKKNS